MKKLYLTVFITHLLVVNMAFTTKASSSDNRIIRTNGYIQKLYLDHFSLYDSPNISVEEIKRLKPISTLKYSCTDSMGNNPKEFEIASFQLLIFGKKIMLGVKRKNNKLNSLKTLKKLQPGDAIQFTGITIKGYLVPIQNVALQVTP